MVGIYSSGYIYTALATSLGQTNWHSNYSFSFDFSIYNNNNNAIKLNYSSKRWDKSEFDRIFDSGLNKLKILSKTSKKIGTGSYTVYLEPSALSEIIDMMAWGGFSYKSNKIGTSPLHLYIRMRNHYIKVYPLMKISKMVSQQTLTLKVLSSPRRYQ